MAQQPLMWHQRLWEEPPVLLQWLSSISVRSMQWWTSEESIKEPPSGTLRRTHKNSHHVPGVDDACHMSLYKSKKLWVSDSKGNLVQTDQQGNQLQKVQTSGRFEGYHTVTQSGSLFFTDKHNNVIKKIKKKFPNH